MAKVAVAAALTRGSLAQRLHAYTRERFPLAPYAFATCLFFFAGYLFARALTGEPRIADGRALVGTATTFLVFFHLRVMDEHKDAAEDARVHPDRPVPRGLVRLEELRAVGMSAVAVELALSLALGAAALAAYLAVLTFTGLMYREFFVGERLRSRPVAYTLAHMLVLPVMATYAWAVAVPDAGVPAAYGSYAILSYGIGLLLELARKVRGDRRDEREGVFTWSARFGPRGAAAIAILVLAATTISAAAIGRTVGFGPFYEIGILGLAAVAVAAFAAFGRAPRAASARRLEKVHAPLYMAGIYGLVIAHAVARTAANAP